MPKRLLIEHGIYQDQCAVAVRYMRNGKSHEDRFPLGTSLHVLRRWRLRCTDTNPNRRYPRQPLFDHVGRTPPCLPANKHCYIYFVRAGNFIKIGRAINPEHRLADLQMTSPKRLVLLIAVAGNPRDETTLHRRFRDLRVQGEWFRFGGALVWFITSLQQGLKLDDLLSVNMDQAVAAWSARRAGAFMRPKPVLEDDGVLLGLA